MGNSELHKLETRVAGFDSAVPKIVADFIQEAVRRGTRVGARVDIVDKTVGWLFTDIIFRVTGPVEACKKWDTSMRLYVDSIQTPT